MHATLLELHRWVGLLAGLAIFVIAVTGCILVFEGDLDRYLNRDLMLVEPGTSTIPLAAAVAAVRAAHPNDPPTGISLPRQPHHALLVSLESRQSACVDPYTGRMLGTRDRFDGLAQGTHFLHTSFLAGAVGERIVGGFTVLTLLMALSGLVLWWPRRILAVSGRRSWRRLNFDLHNVLGLYSSAVLVVICLSGILIAYEPVTDPLVLKLNARPTRPAVVSSTVIEGAAAISPDEAVRIARETLPGLFVGSLNLPRPGTAVYRVAGKYPEDRTPGGRTRIAIDQYSGAVLDVVSTREAQLGTRILNLKRSLHTGDVFGAPSRAVAFLASLMLAGQVVTGFLIWWKPGRLARTADGRGPAPASTVGGPAVGVGPGR